MPTIAAVCPRCDSTYQVDPGLIGKRMRCPNPICRAVFEVKDPGTPSASPPGPVEKTPPGETVLPGRPVQQTGNVSDFLPILPAEAGAPRPEPPRPEPPAPLPKPAAFPRPAPVREKPRPAPKPASPTPPPRKPEPVPQVEPSLPETPSWEAAPPPVRGQAVEQAAVAVAPSPPPETEESDLDFSELEGDQETGIAPAPAAKEAPTPASPPASATGPAPVTLEPGGHVTKARRRHLALMVLMGLVLAGLGVGAAFLIQGKKASDEAERSQAALKAYEEMKFDEAVLLFRGLGRDFPESTRAREYKLLEELSELRKATRRPGSDPAEVERSLTKVQQFLELYKNDPLLIDRHGDVWLTLEHLAKDLVALAGSRKDDKLLKRARAAITEAEQFKPPAGSNHVEARKFLDEQIGQVEKAIEKERFEKESLTLLRSLEEVPPLQGIQAARALIASRGIDPEKVPKAKEALEGLKKKHHDSIRFIAKEGLPETRTPPDTAWNLALAPTVASKSPAEVGGLPLLALARGVLYGLDPRLGEVRWARRLGVDTQHLPLRVPASLSHPDFLVAVATDPPAILALSHADGREIWRHSLPGPGLCPPIQVEERLLVPLLSGRVEEIDLSSGRMLGHYDLGQPLLAGGTRQPGTPYVYLPASEACLYVLDVKEHKCVQVLYLWHPPGSIAVPPLVLTEPEGEGKKAGKGWLLLSRAAGDKAELLRYALPLAGPEVEPVEAIPLPARHSHPGLRAADRLAFAGDDSSLTLFGIRTRGGSGPLLYPFLPEASVLAAPGAAPSPALLAHADPQRWWVLARGQLYHFRLVLSPTKGMELLSLWGEHPSRDLGTPLHAAEFRGGPSGEGLLFLATQARDEPVCLATAFDPDDGTVRWQRQLGPISQGPVRLAGEHHLLQDTRGILKWTLPKDRPPSGWSALTAWKREVNLVGLETQWLAGEGEPALLAWKGSTSSETAVHLHTWVEGDLRSRSWSLSAAPVGSAARAGDTLVVPLADGTLVQLALNEDKKTILDPWRPKATEGKLVPHVLPLKEGAHALALLEEPNRLTLLRSGEKTASWSLPGKVTAGPGWRGAWLVCVVGKNRVVVLDPAKPGELWEHPCIAQVVGLPERDGDRLVVADWSGRIAWLALKPGLPVVRTVNLEPRVIPVAAPAAREGRLYLALSDGMLMILDPAETETKPGK